MPRRLSAVNSPSSDGIVPDSMFIWLVGVGHQSPWGTYSAAYHMEGYTQTDKVCQSLICHSGDALDCHIEWPYIQLQCQQVSKRTVARRNWSVQHVRLKISKERNKQTRNTVSHRIDTTTYMHTTRKRIDFDYLHERLYPEARATNLAPKEACRWAN
jgi:hypothetical protein